MRILHIVAELAPESGIAAAVLALARAQSLLGHQARIVTLSDDAGGATGIGDEAAHPVVRLRRAWPRAIYWSWGLLRALPRLAREADVVHVHSQWTFPVWWGCRCALAAGRRLAMSPHGCLNPAALQHSAWKKRAVAWLDRACLRRAHCIHATSEMEAEWIRKFLGEGQGRARAAVIPHGVEMVAGRAPEAEAQRRRQADGRTLLYLGRLHPLKGLEMLVEAWGLLRPPSGRKGEGKREGDHQVVAMARVKGGEGWRLVIAGPDEQGTKAALERQARELGVMESIVFRGPVAGEEKERLLQEADLLVLPSRSENFGLAVAEALAAGVPVITTKAAPWGELDCDHAVVAMARVKGEGDHAVVAMARVKGEGDHSVVARERVKGGCGRCGWWVEPETEALKKALSEAMSLSDEERRLLGEKGRRLVEAKYRWDSVAERMLHAYAGA